MKLKRIFEISRPFVWVWIILAYLLGMGNFGNFTLFSFIEFLLMALPLNFVIYSINDYYDRKSDVINLNKDGIQGAKVNEKEFKGIIIWNIVFSGVILIWSGLFFSLQHTILILGWFIFNIF